jgi:hypothetical protein
MDLDAALVTLCGADLEHQVELIGQAVGRDGIDQRTGTPVTSQFFGSTWARYDLAKPGTFRLTPPPGRFPALRRAHQAMRDMYLSEPPAFEKVMTILQGRQPIPKRDS